MAAKAKRRLNHIRLLGLVNMTITIKTMLMVAMEAMASNSHNTVIINISPTDTTTISHTSTSHITNLTTAIKSINLNKPTTKLRLQ